MLLCTLFIADRSISKLHPKGRRVSFIFFYEILAPRSREF